MAYGFGWQKVGNQRIVGLSPERLPGLSANKTCTKGFADKCPGCSVVPAESGIDFSQELPPFLFGDASLEHSRGAFLIKLSLMDFVGLGAPHNATCLILVFGKFLPKQVG